MFKYQTVWQKEGFLLSRRFVSSLPLDEQLFHHAGYRKQFEIGLILSLILVSSVFFISKRIVQKNESLVHSVVSLTVEEIPQTQQTARTAAPTMPTIPVASEDESLPADETIDFTDLDFETVPQPPPPPPPSDEESETMFIAWDEPPTPVGGFAAIRRNVVYPDIATRAGVEGTVVLRLRIMADGSIKEVRVVQSVMDAMDQAAEAAVRSVKWLPAKQRDEAVAVWYVVPIEFKLRTASQR